MSATDPAGVDMADLRRRAREAVERDNREAEELRQRLAANVRPHPALSAQGEGTAASSPKEPTAQQEADAERAAIQQEAEKPTRTPRDPFSWLKDHEMTDEEAQQIADPTWIEPGFIVASHVIAIVAKPSAGKTTILFHLACHWPPLGYHVVYVHADTNPADAKGMRELAQECGVRYLTPDLKVGKAMLDVLEELERLAASDVDLHGWVFIFDTLKKMTNVINKGALRDLLALLRKLSARGMTVVLLAHTNKYKNAEGDYQYEGTADLLSDVDELIYFEPRDNPDGSLTVSTRKEKCRAEIRPMTWDIAPDRTVSVRTEYLDVAAEARAAKQREEDAPAIEAITACLFQGPKKQTEIIEQCRAPGLHEKRVRRVLMTYTGDLWRSERLFEKNAWRYTLLAKKERRR